MKLISVRVFHLGTYILNAFPFNVVLSNESRESISA